MAPIPPLARRGAEPLSEYLKSLQARRAAHERVRLIYVAATRAREELHLFADLPGSQRPPPGTLLAALWPAAAGEFLQERPQAPPENRPPDNGPPENRSPARLMRLPADWRLPAFPAAPAVDGLIASSQEPVRLDDENGLDEVAHRLLRQRAAERAVCDQLRRCARRGRLPGDEDWIERALRDRLVRLGFEGADLAEETQRAASLWKRCVADSQLQWIFSERHTQAESPFELSGLYEGRLVTLTIDRMFADDRGVRWMVNFRPAPAPASAGESQRDESDLEKAVALAQELGAQKLGAQKLGAQDVRAGVYFPSLPAFREFPEG
jgi:ATP-dependent helicase/nuclease subunit A